MGEGGRGEVIVGSSEGVPLVNPFPAAGENDPALIHNYLLLLCTLSQRRGNKLSLSHTHTPASEMEGLRAFVSVFIREGV